MPTKKRFFKILTFNVLSVFVLSIFMPAVIAQTPSETAPPPAENFAPLPQPLPQPKPEPTAWPESQPIIQPIIKEAPREPLSSPPANITSEIPAQPVIEPPKINNNESLEPVPYQPEKPQEYYLPPVVEYPLPQEYPKPQENFPLPLPKPEFPSPDASSYGPPTDYELKKTLPRECVEAGVIDQFECDKFIQRKNGFSEKMPYPQPPTSEASPGLVPSIGSICQQAGITDQSECEKFIRKKAEFEPKKFPEGQPGPERPMMPTSASFTPPSPKEAFTKILPAECQAAGITIMEECNKIMQEKMKEKFDFDFKAGPMIGSSPNLKEPPPEMIMMMRSPVGGFGFEPDFKEMQEQEMKMRIEMKLNSGQARECQNKDANECRQILQEKMKKAMESAEYLPPECEQAGLKNLEECKQTLLRANLPPECREANISDPSECKIIMFTQNMPPECRAEGITSPEECEKSLVKRHLPPECRDLGVESPEDCEKIMLQKHLPPECKNKGIKQMDDCEKFLAKSYAPKICADQDALNPTQCQKVIIATYGQPKECAGLSDFECMKLIKAGQAGQDIVALLNKDLPPKCLELGAKTMFECEELSLEKNIPPECKEAGAFTKEACDKVMFQKFSPEPCLKANTQTREECDKIMETLYLPQECKKAGLTAKKECDILLQKLHTPAECQAVGAYTKEACEKIMRTKYAAPECKESGITDENACQALMMKKYAQEVKCQGLDNDLCQIAIEKRHLGQLIKKKKDVEEIKEKINPLIGKNFKIKTEVKEKLEKKAEEVVKPSGCECPPGFNPVCGADGVTYQNMCYAECANITVIARDACQNVDIAQLETQKRLLETGHPDQPAAEQAALQESVEKMEELIPIEPEQETNLLIIPAVEKSVILENETIIQTVPAAIMFDNDEDAVPNDIEERLGTNPNNSDTDNDGFPDGEEFKNNYNPLGSGNIWQSGLTEEMSDFDQALFNNRPLDQPLVSGEEFPEELVIESAGLETPSAPEAKTPEETGLFGLKPVFAQEKRETPIKLQGLAAPNTVIAVFIYSELALVATVKTDASGHWEYVIDQPLTDGEHTVYIATLNSAGKVLKKSQSFPLFIKEAKAVTAQDLISKDLYLKAGFNWLQLIIIVAIVIVLVGLAYVLYCKKTGKKIIFTRPKIPNLKQ